MWQRIQTIYMLLAFVALVLFNFFSLANFSFNDTTWELMPYQFVGNEMGGAPLYFLRFGGIAANLVALVILFMITRYNNRRLQLRLGHISYFFLLVLTVVMYINMGSIKDFMEESMGKIEVVYNLGSYLPVIAIAFLILANRSIKKDEELIRSMDRLR
ncbi:DUF4293 domain-containing protein [Luteibaculum oceani]|uniref:DUF4293 family protein n=1 Tax=Luteibaculum oceani TaxID=1294296 RepID=A0A5C6VA21_9FLAO|nr:DUF4293 domain-containing protein [Luteibaculum oceani]TXC81321.1 DUF4293 family protein [Luteibaculum oceani]